MINASEEKRIKKEIEEQEWLMKAILACTADKSISNTKHRVNHITRVSGRIAQLKRELYECQHPRTDI